MRYIIVPKPVELTNLTLTTTNKHPLVTFSGFIRQILVQDPSVTATDDKLEMFTEVAELFADATPGSVVEITDRHHEFFMNLAKGFAYASESKFDLLPLIRAVTSAKKEAPVTQAPNEAASKSE